MDGIFSHAFCNRNVIFMTSAIMTQNTIENVLMKLNYEFLHYRSMYIMAGISTQKKCQYETE